MNEDKNYQDKLIDIIEDLPEKEVRRSKLDLLQRIIARTDEYENDCEICKNNQSILENIVTKIHYSDQSYLEDMKAIKNHLIKNHKLLEEGHYMSLCMIYGIAIGTGLGVVLENIPIFVSAGLTMGVAVGVAMDAKAKKDKKVL